MRLLTAFLVVLLVAALIVPPKSDGQSLSVGYSPTSVELIGNTEYAQSIQIEYFHNVFTKNKFNISLGTRFQKITITDELEYDRGEEIHTNHNRFKAYKKYSFKGDYRSLFFMGKTSFDDLFYNIGVSHSLGVGHFFRKYPDDISGTNLHISMSPQVFKRFGDHLMVGIEYSHISNLGTGDVNFGIDNIYSKITWSF